MPKVSTSEGFGLFNSKIITLVCILPLVYSLYFTLTDFKPKISSLQTQNSEFVNSKFLNSKFRVSKLKISSLKFEAGKLSLTGHRTVQEKQQREKPERCDVFVCVWAFFAWLPY